jgi:hypothetical protein
MRCSLHRTAAAVALLPVAFLFGSFRPAVAADSTTTTKPSTTVAPKDRVTRKKPCRVLTKTDLQRALGATATSTGNSISGALAVCRWSVDANGDRPAGLLRVGITFGVPKGAYQALSKNAQYVVVDGLEANALYQPSTGTISIFKGTTIVTIRGTFVDTTVRPVRPYDAEPLLTGLAQTVIPKL